MARFTISRDSLSLATIFPVFPAISFVLIIARYRHGSVVHNLLISLFFAVLAFNLTPYQGMDLSSYYARFQGLADLGVLEIAKEYNSNLAIIYFMKLLQVVGFKKEFVPFFIVFISYFTFLSAVGLVLSRGKLSSLDSAVVAIVSLLLISFVNNAVGLRSGFSTSLFVLACANFYYGRNGYFLVLSLFGILVHPYILLGAAAILVAAKLPSKIVSRVCLFSPVFIVVGIGQDFAIEVVEFIFPTGFAEYVVRGYILHEAWGVNANNGWKADFISNFVLSSPFYVAWLFLSTLSLSRVKDIDRAAMLIVIFVFLFWDFYTVSNRYKDLAVMMSLLSVFVYFSNLRFVNKIAMLKAWPVWLFLASGVLNSLWGLYRYRYALESSFHHLYLPFPYTFLHYVDMDKLKDISGV